MALPPTAIRDIATVKERQIARVGLCKEPRESVVRPGNGWQADIVPSDALTNHRPADGREDLDRGVGEKTYGVRNRDSPQVGGEYLHRIPNSLPRVEHLARATVEPLLAHEQRSHRAAEDAENSEDYRQLDEREAGLAAHYGHTASVR